MNARRYQLRPWMVRTLLPPTVIGAYVLWDRDKPVYAGRSDTSLRRRLLEHAGKRSADYFSYDAAGSVSAAFDMECSLFHALKPDLRNSIHPQRPDESHHGCAFCTESVAHARSWTTPRGLGLTTAIAIHGPA